MSSDDKPSREERLAARLRDNLRRRKAQQRARGTDGSVEEPVEPGSGLPKRDEGG